jgi:hypothetical protein
VTDEAQGHGDTLDIDETDARATLAKPGELSGTSKSVPLPDCVAKLPLIGMERVGSPEEAAAGPVTAMPSRLVPLMTGDQWNEFIRLRRRCQPRSRRRARLGIDGTDADAGNAAGRLRSLWDAGPVGAKIEI